MGKMTRRQMTHTLSNIINTNHRLAEVASTSEIGRIYKDIAFLAKCVRYLERQSGVGKDVQFEFHSPVK